MRRLQVASVVTLLTMIATASVATAQGGEPGTMASGPASWVSGERSGQQIEATSGEATFYPGGAIVTVQAVGLIPGHTYTAWLRYFNDDGTCSAGEESPQTRCGFGDLPSGAGGVVGMDGLVADGDGDATFSGHIFVGDDPEIGPEGIVAYDPVNPSFHVIIRSHGPMVPSTMPAQIDTRNGGCESEVGPPPPVGSGSEFPIPASLGECGDVQIFVFEGA